MGNNSAIEWTDDTWNVVTGCTKVSPGCAYCYITRTPPFRKAGRRFERVGVEMRTDIQLHYDRLDWPLRWRKPRRIFVNSLSDLFHEDVPDEFIAEVFAVMSDAKQHTFQILTKRPERALRFLVERPNAADPHRPFWPAWETSHGVLNRTNMPLPNVWIGVSVENQRWTSRLDVLAQIPAAVRFVSAEPLLGSLDLRRYLAAETSALGPPSRALDWVIVGGESGRNGPRANRRRLVYEEALMGRNEDVDYEPTAKGLAWVRAIRDQCVDAGVPFFFKQWGGPLPRSTGAWLDRREWKQWPSEDDAAARVGSRRGSRVPALP